MIKCPSCGYVGYEKEFKQLRNPWKFRFYTVQRLACPKCGIIFNYYNGTSPNGKRSEFVIWMKPKKTKKI
ncbi:MAG: hypothetical protein C0179_07105 [Fervidicoccus sp.]|nr:MAG: hypothetical protein C0179_07105 [Fervidicoccus sp.]